MENKSETQIKESELSLSYLIIVSVLVQERVMKKLEISILSELSETITLTVKNPK